MLTRLRLVALLAAVCVMLTLQGAPLQARIRQAGYGLFRSAVRTVSLNRVKSLPTILGQHFTVYYQPGEEWAARQVRAAAEDVYDATVELVGYRPAGRVPVVVHPSRASMRRAFGWSGSEAVTGVYWAGVIRVLTPGEWVGGNTPEEQGEEFRILNPLSHELTHYLLDYLAGGHYPRWYTEGLAQWVEAQVTGYRWLEPRATLNQPLYSLLDLTRRFDQLRNQALAYRQAFLLVQYLVERCGEEGLHRLNAALAAAPTFEAAVHQVCGVPKGALESEWHVWAGLHRDELEAELFRALDKRKQFTQRRRPTFG